MRRPKNGTTPAATGVGPTAQVPNCSQHSAIAGNAHDHRQAFIAGTTTVRIGTHRTTWLTDPSDLAGRSALCEMFACLERQGTRPRWHDRDADFAHDWRFSDVVLRPSSLSLMVSADSLAVLERREHAVALRPLSPGVR